MPDGNLDTLCINTLRLLAADAVQQAGNGHPGGPMGQAAMAYTLWDRFLKHNPTDPSWHDRDRFVLSAGHASMLLYGLLHLTGYDLPLDEIKRLRQWGSITPGHPSAALRPASRSRPAPSARASPTPSASPSESSGSPVTTTAPATPSSTTTPTSSPPTAT